MIFRCERALYQRLSYKFNIISNGVILVLLLLCVISPSLRDMYGDGLKKIVDRLLRVNSVPGDVIQSLWSGYGAIQRFSLDRPPFSIIVKYINLRSSCDHPRGWSGQRSHQRKRRSYEVELYWYENYSNKLASSCRSPVYYGCSRNSDEIVLIMEDLDLAGYKHRVDVATPAALNACIRWLAAFHARFMGSEAAGLWPVGTYWHLDTRPDELAVLTDNDLKEAAPMIDRRLYECPFQTLVHGDAKIANFCFGEGLESAAAVDFQYVGGGCGMKDLSYLVGSCVSEQDCLDKEEEILDTYFDFLDIALKENHSDIDVRDVEKVWRSFYRLAWADFYRFLKGWSPHHRKINSYGQYVTAQVVGNLLKGGQ